MAEAVFGWGRQTVARGLAERRTGIMCRGAQSACSGRQRWEERHPQVAEALRQLADVHAQQDPTFRTSLTSTRLTAKAALEALRAQGYGEEFLPSPSTMAEVLNRMGFRLRKVVKAKPQKKIKETDAIFDNIKKR
jgi:Rhodopirellula transposase DDE domain